MHRRSALKLCAATLALPVVATSARPARAIDKVERVIGKVGRNHGHVLTVSPADVLAGVPKTYDITGTSGHLHEVTLSAEDFKVLQTTGVFRTTATRFEGRGHLHRILVKTAPLVDPPDAIGVVDVTIPGKDDHELVISAPQLAAKVDKTYDIQGVAGHTHALTVTAADFAKLADGHEVNIRSSMGDDHFHLVFLRYPSKKP